MKIQHERSMQKLWGSGGSKRKARWKHGKTSKGIDCDYLCEAGPIKGESYFAFIPETQKEARILDKLVEGVSSGVCLCFAGMKKEVGAVGPIFVNGFTEEDGGARFKDSYTKKMLRSKPASKGK